MHAGDHSLRQYRSLLAVVIMNRLTVLRHVTTGGQASSRLGAEIWRMRMDNSFTLDWIGDPSCTRLRGHIQASFKHGFLDSNTDLALRVPVSEQELNL